VKIKCGFATVLVANSSHSYKAQARNTGRRIGFFQVARGKTVRPPGRKSKVCLGGNGASGYLAAINGADVGVRLRLTPSYGKNTVTVKYPG